MPLAPLYPVNIFLKFCSPRPACSMLSLPFSDPWTGLRIALSWTCIYIQNFVKFEDYSALDSVRTSRGGFRYNEQYSWCFTTWIHYTIRTNRIRLVDTWDDPYDMVARLVSTLRDSYGSYTICTTRTDGQCSVTSRYKSIVIIGHVWLFI